MEKNEAINNHFTGIDPYEDTFERDLSSQEKALAAILMAVAGILGRFFK